MSSSKSIFSVILFLLNFAVHAMQQATVPYNSIEDVQKACFLLLKELDSQQTIYHTNSSGEITKNFKLLQAPDHCSLVLCCVIQTLCDAVRKRLGSKKSWYVHAIDESETTFTNGEVVTKGLAKEVSNNESTECSYKTLQKQIKKVIRRATTGWRLSTLAECPDLYFTKSEDTHSLLVKSDTTKNEKALFRFLTMIIKPRNNFSCDNSRENENLLYLWIKKTAFEHVCSALKLKLVDNHNNSIDDIQKKCLTLLKKLNTQPTISNNNGDRTTKQFRALEEEDYTICCIIETLCNAVMKQIGPKKAWRISAFLPFQIGLENNRAIGNCVVKQLYNNHELTECSYKTLQHQIKKVIKNATSNWKLSTLSEYPDIYFTESEETHSLLVKQATIEEEIELFGLLINSMKLHDSVSCYSSWKDDRKHKNLFYLWIKRTAFEHVCQALKLKIS